MNWNSINVILAMAPPPQPGQKPPPLWTSFVPMILIMVVFYFVLIYPQQKKAKQHDQLLKTLKPGDKICTSSGILAVVISVKEKTVSIRSGDAKMEILKSAVTEIHERGSSPTEA